MALFSPFMYLNNYRQAKTSAYTIVNTDRGKTLALSGNAFYALSANAASGYDPDFAVNVLNEDPTRGKYLTLPGMQPFIIWPKQSFILFIQNNAWNLHREPQWRPAQGTTNVYTDFVNGSDNNDGMAPGAGNAFKTVQGAFLRVFNDWILDGTTLTKVVINMADNTTDTTAVSIPVHAFVGAGSSGAVTIAGATRAISGAADNGSGLIRLTVSSTTGYTTGDVKFVTGVAGVSGANGTFVITVVDATHIDLQGTSFSGTYTPGTGVIAGMSIINPAGADAIYVGFGGVVTVRDLTLRSTVNGLNVIWGGKVILNNVTFGGGGQVPAGGHIGTQGYGQVELAGPIIFAGNSTYGFLFSGGQFRAMGYPIHMSADCAFTTFLLGAEQGMISFVNSTLALNGHTITGKRFDMARSAQVLTRLGDGNLNYFPGSIAGTLGVTSGYDGIIFGIPDASPSPADLVVTEKSNLAATVSLEQVAGITRGVGGGYISGRFNFGQAIVSPDGTGTLVVAANTLYFMPFVVAKRTTFVILGVNVQVAAAGAFARLGMYNWANGVPTSLIFDVGNVSVDAPIGNKESTISQTINAGYYALAFLCSGTPTILTSTLSQLGYDMLGSTAVVPADQNMTATFAYTGLPANITFGSGGIGARTYATTAKSMLAMWLKS